MRIKKLTRQWAGYSDFKYCVEFTHKDIANFCDRRNWCWEQWGPSCELMFVKTDDTLNIRWCWLADQHRIRIYLKSDQEASWYSLKWG